VFELLVSLLPENPLHLP